MIQFETPRARASYFNKIWSITIEKLSSNYSEITLKEYKTKEAKALKCEFIYSDHCKW